MHEERRILEGHAPTNKCHKQMVLRRFDGGPNEGFFAPTERRSSQGETLVSFREHTKTGQQRQWSEINAALLTKAELYHCRLHQETQSEWDFPYSTQTQPLMVPSVFHRP